MTNPVHPKLKKILGLAKGLGVSVQSNSVNSEYKPGPFNRVIFVLINNPAYLFSNIDESIEALRRDLAHELGHFLVATKRQRRLKDYGIPPRRPSMSEKTKEKWDLLDEKASLVAQEISNILDLGHELSFTPKLAAWQWWEQEQVKYRFLLEWFCQ